MHYYVLVLLPNTYADSTRDEIEEAVKDALSPCLDGLSGEERENVQDYIDSFEFVIGGRWSGVLGKDILPVSELPRPLPDDAMPYRIEIDDCSDPDLLFGPYSWDFCSKDQWRVEVHDILMACRNSLAVVVDLHE